ncbi:hypothetical protein PENSPDRAFT_655777 [Peniophora sp. CONT]|nr:hypothetical protein PENSPDRAFT_655777 [Peniophora sp. CONT]
MSSEEEGGSKKRRIERACDTCRKKKIRCDGMQANKKCSHCNAFKLKCTYVEAAKKRAPPKAYVESLEERLKSMEALLQKMSSSEAGPSGSSGQMDSTMNYGEGSSSSGRGREESDASAPRTPYVPGIPDADPEPSDDEADVLLGRMNLNSRFFGRSSDVSLVKTALDVRRGLLSGSDTQAAPWRFPRRRPEHWTSPPWQEDSWAFGTGFTFPEPDLLTELVALFFKHTNTILPVLHRPSFERDLAEGRHLRESSFGVIVLCVCACASRLSDDTRCYMDGSQDRDSAGWRWFNQMRFVPNTAFNPMTVSDLQVYAIRSMFLLQASTLQAAWTMVGIGIRMGQDIGAHRRKLYSSGPTVAGEQQKRAFWVMVYIDRTLSALLGRSCAIQSEDFDLEMPADVDDDYWQPEDGSEPFKQPPGRPTTIAAFIHQLKLSQILSFTLRSIYSIQKSKVFLGFVGPDWEHNVIAELDSALTKWHDAIPEHLRWDPNRQDNPLFHSLSASLITTYYVTQISVHRPFMMRRDKPALSAPSTLISLNAARAGARVIEVFQRNPRMIQGPPMFLQPAAFTSAILLLLNIWASKQTGAIMDAAKDLEYIRICMDWIKATEKRSYTAGRCWDILNELSTFGEAFMQSGDSSQTTLEQDSSPSSIPSTAPPQPSDHSDPSSRTSPEEAAGAYASSGPLDAYKHTSPATTSSGASAGPRDYPFDSASSHEDYTAPRMQHQQPPPRPSQVQSHANSFTSLWSGQAAENPADFVARPMVVPSQNPVDFPGPRDFAMHNTLESNVYPGQPSSQRTTYGVSNERNAYGAGPSGGPGGFGADAFGGGNVDLGMFGGMRDMMGFGFQGLGGMGMGEMLDQWGAAAGMSGGMYDGTPQGGMNAEADPMNLLWGRPPGE